MPPFKSKKEQLPETFVLRTLYRVFRFVNHVRTQVLITLILAVTLSVAWAIYRSMRPDEIPGPMPVAQVALTNDNVLSWVNAAHKLAEKRKAGSFRVRVDTLKTFIEWSRTRSSFLSEKLDGMSVQEFIGIALTLDNARRNIRILVEHDIRVQEQYAMLQINPGLDLPPLTAPSINQADMEDLKVYEYNLNAVEAVLFDLIPGIRLPVPAWEEQPATPAAVEGSDANPSAPQNKIKWKVVNPSRYGPRVIKVR